jgi:hypothetical protein
MCPGCRKYAGKYECGGCGDDWGLWCGHCARPVFVAWIGSVMLQRLCPACRLSGENPIEHGIYDARHFNLKELQEFYRGKTK